MRDVGKLCLFTIICILLGVFASCYENSADATAWNDGYCECGSEWELFDVEKVARTTYYYYKCDCGEVIRLYNQH